MTGAWDRIVKMEAMETGGAWQVLGSGYWGGSVHREVASGSVHVQPGNLVKFRMLDRDNVYLESCWFTHPQGVEQCTTPPPPPPPSGGAFSPTFTNVHGNEWWIQAGVTSSGDRVAGVDVALNNGSWQPLMDKGWGWAASYHASVGTIVQFRATSTTGASSLSSCYHWTDAAVATCSGGTTPPPPPPTNSTFTATFSNVRGNEWWVESNVAVTGGTLAGADARVNGGTWIGLDHQSWGSWAKSIHASSGSTVQFRARATDGSTATSTNYAWPPA